MEHCNWYEVFINDIKKTSDEYFLMLEYTRNSIAPILYSVVNGEIEHDNALDDKIFDKYFSHFESMDKYGIHMFRYINHEFVEYKLITHYNTALFDNDLFELLIYQQYGMYPAGTDRKEVLKKSIKAEKIKDTLVYACYLNDTDKILKCLETANKSDLNKSFGSCGTPLGICAQNDNLEAFSAIAEKGADINKSSFGYTPLEFAFHYSPAIVHYIYYNHREQFLKEAQRKGFSLAYQCKEISSLELLKDTGCDMVCNKKNFPPLLNFVDYNNPVGIQFLVDNGVPLDVVNNHGQTALDRAKRRNHPECIELLEKLSK